MCDKMLILILLQQYLFLIAIRLTNCVIKLLINVFFYLFVFLINVKIKQSVMCANFISENPFGIRYITDQFQTQQMRDEAVDDCLASLK